MLFAKFSFMEEWKLTKIGSLCKKVCSGGTPKSTVEEYYGGGIPWLNTKEVNFNRIYSTESTISETGLSNSSAKWIDKHSVIVAMYGATAAKCAIGMIPMTTNQACCNLMINEDLADYRFVYYALTNAYSTLASLANGGAQQNLNAQLIKDFEIPLPDLRTQHRIADILSTIDDKIENNIRINHNLLNLAQELFNNSFVKNSCCSDTCRAASLLDIAEYLNGLAMQKYPATDGEVGIPVLKIKELGQQACDANSDKCSESIPAQYVVNDGDIIFSWSGTLLVDFWCGGICGLNQHLFKVSSDKFPNWFVYFWTKHHLDRFIRIAKDKAVTMGHIKRGDLGKAEVIIPEASQMGELDEEIRPLISEYIDRRVENRKLRNLRDSLLPELMLGNLTC